MSGAVAFGQAIGDETRWRIVQLLLNEPLCVCEVADVLEMRQSTVSSHLQVIKKAGLLDSEECGKWIYYMVSPRVRELVEAVARDFGSGGGLEKCLKADRARAVKRLAERASGCCPLPQGLTKLATRKVKNNQRKVLR